MARNKSEELYVCFEPFVAAGEYPPISVKLGERLRGDHPMVRKHGQYFCPADLPDDEIKAARMRFWEVNGPGTPAA
jgi:hypothetical protein